MRISTTEMGPGGRDARTQFLVVLFTLTCIFSITARWTLPYHIDPVTNAITGWYWANSGSPIAVEHDAYTAPEQLGNLGWFVPSPRGPISQYPVGGGVLPAIAYGLTATSRTPMVMSGTENPNAESLVVPMPPMWPATASSVLAVAAACAALAVIYRQLGGTSVQSVLAGLFSGLATSAWSVASKMSWTHGPSMLLIALGLLAASKDRWLLSGLAFGGAVLVRPHIAVIPAAVAICVGVAMRSWRPVFWAGGGSLLGLGVLLAFNFWVWGDLTISGGYGTGFTQNLISTSLGAFVLNVVGALVDVRHGLLVWAPFLAIGVPAAILMRKRAPRWTIGAAIGGILYLLIQLRANRFSGGDGHFSYRYPLEGLTAAAPLLFYGYIGWIRQRPRLHRAFLGLGIVAIVGQLVGALKF